MPFSRKIEKALAAITGPDHVTASPADRACYAWDATTIGVTGERRLPDVVVFPGTTQEVARILSLAGEEDVPVVPRGAGTGMTGGAVPVAGGIVLSLTRMNRILSIDTENLLGRAESGVITGRFHEEVEKKGLFYPPDPGSSRFSTLGGNLAECAGGPRAVKYGVTRDYVLGLTAALPTGEIVHTGVQTRKGVAGYDLTRLLVGSEGTLAVITEMTLRLLPLPESVKTMVAVFNEVSDAARTVTEVIRSGVIPRTVEFMDNAAIRCVENYNGAGLPADAAALLIIEVDGLAGETLAMARSVQDVCARNHARETKIAQTPEAAAAVWNARKGISPALARLAPHKINEDIVVPRSRIPDLLEKVEEIRTETGLTIVCFGHAGDGNIHFNIMLDLRDEARKRLAEGAVEKVFDIAVGLGGTITGEHGVGMTKARYLGKEIDPPTLDLMKRIKSLFDPRGILNPHKIF